MIGAKSGSVGVAPASPGTGAGAKPCGAPTPPGVPAAWLSCGEITLSRIQRLLPQKGAMSLLDGVREVSDDFIVCRAVSHLDPANPLAASGRLGILCGCEYGMQAAALHGALLSGVQSRVGRLAALRITHVAAARLDDPGFGVLTVYAHRRAGGSDGLLYDFRLTAEDGRELLAGRGTIALASNG